MPAEASWVQRAGGFATVLDRATGAYLGLAIGDALGATVEFTTPREIRARFAAQGGVHRHIIGGGWLKLPAGQVTDDTTMSLALGEALLEGGRSGRPCDPQLMAEAFVRWWRGRPVDCGNTCRRGIQRFLHDGSLQGPPNDGDAGNGAAMRNLPVVLATLGDEVAFMRASLAQARITHHHPLSDGATVGLGRILRALLLGQGPAEAARQCDELAARHPPFRFRPYPGRATAYVVDTVQTVLHAYTSHDGFEPAVLAAVNQGEDADTTGALVGMLAGARCGARALPRAWLRDLAPAVSHAVTDQASALLALALQRSPETAALPADPS